MNDEQFEKEIDEALAELVTDFREPLRAIAAEIEHQRQKWGREKPQSLPGFLLVLESELAEAKHGWIKNLNGRNSPLAEVVQIAAVAIACLSRYGTNGSAGATNDTTEAELWEARMQASEQRWGAR